MKYQARSPVRIACAVLFAAVACASAQVTHFKPGEWKIQTTAITGNSGSNSYTTEICASNPKDTWKSRTSNVTCDPAQTAEKPDGLHIAVHCQGGNQMFHMDIQVHYLYLISPDGERFTGNGTSDTSITVNGRPPIVEKTLLKVQGSRIGSCTSAPAQ
jgi:hypothetical protein